MLPAAGRGQGSRVGAPPSAAKTCGGANARIAMPSNIVGKKEFFALDICCSSLPLVDAIGHGPYYCCATVASVSRLTSPTNFCRAMRRVCVLDGGGRHLNISRNPALGVHEVVRGPAEARRASVLKPEMPVSTGSLARSACRRTDFYSRIVPEVGFGDVYLLVAGATASDRGSSLLQRIKSYPRSCRTTESSSIAAHLRMSQSFTSETANGECSISSTLNTSSGSITRA